MSYQVSPDGQGGTVVQSSGGRNIGHTGVTAGGYDDVTGEYQSGWTEQELNNQFVGSEITEEALPPEYHIRQRMETNPITSPTGSEADVARWILTPGDVSQAEIQGMIEAFDQNDIPDAQRDLMLDLLCLKEGSKSFAELSAEAKAVLAPYMGEGYEQYYQESEEDSEGEETNQLEMLVDHFGIREAFDRMDEQSQQDLEVLGGDVLNAQPDANLAESQQADAQNLYNAGDYQGAFITQLSSAFNSGRMSASECVQEAISKMGLKSAIDAYTRLQYGYSATGNPMSYGRGTTDIYEETYD